MERWGRKKIGKIALYLLFFSSHYQQPYLNSRLSSSLLHFHHFSPSAASTHTQTLSHPSRTLFPHILTQTSVFLAFTRSLAVSSTFARQVEIEHCPLSGIAVKSTLDETMRLRQDLFLFPFIRHNNVLKNGGVWFDLVFTTTGYPLTC